MLGAAGVFAVYALLVDRSRFLEAGVVGALLERITGGRVDGSFSQIGLLYVDPAGDGPQFVARITRSCSVLTPIAVVTWVALSASRGRFARRAAGLAASVALLVAVDLVRVGGIVLAGSRFGTDVMVLAHDWLGTLLTLVSLVLGILVLWAVSGGRPRRSPAPASAAV